MKSRHKKDMHFIKMGLLGAVTGIANGFFGSGGGIIAVPMLKKMELGDNAAKKAHACSLAVTLPLSAVSAVFYSKNGSFDIKTALPLIPLGLLGALLGTAVMKKIPTKWLSRLFGVILIAAGVRGLMM